MRHRSAACGGASAGTLQEMRDQFKPLMHTIFLAWRHCHSSTLAKRLQTLFKRIAYAADRICIAQWYQRLYIALYCIARCGRWRPFERLASAAGPSERCRVEQPQRTALTVMSALVVLPTLAKFGLTLAFDACGAGVCLAPQPIRRRCTDRCSFDIVFAAIDFVDPRSVFHADADEREQAQEVPT